MWGEMHGDCIPKYHHGNTMIITMRGLVPRGLGECAQQTLLKQLHTNQTGFPSNNKVNEKFKYSKFKQVMHVCNIVYM